MRRGFFAIFFCLLALSFWASAQGTPPEGLHTAEAPRRVEPPSPTATIEELEKRAEELRADKAYRDAVDYYLAALGKSSDRMHQASLYNKLGITFLQLQRFKEAERSFSRALKKNRDFADARNNLGAAYYTTKEYSRAIDEYRKAIRLSNQEATYYNNLGTAYFALKDYPHAVEAYRHAVQLDPEIFHRKSRVGVAAQLYAPDDRATFAFLLAKTYAQAGDNDRSLEYLRKAMEDGYRDIKTVYQDEVFAGLRKDPRFVELMASKPKAVTE